MAPPTDRALEREGWQVAGAVEPFSVATLISRVLIKQVARRGFAVENAQRRCVWATVQDRGTDLGWDSVLPWLITFLTLTPGSGTRVSLFLGNSPGWADIAELSGMPVRKNFENF